jgi:hypothetical protein
MIRRRLGAMLIAPLVSAAVVLALASPAAAVTTAEKLSVLSNWTQVSTGSYNAWNSARLNQGAWAAYGFDWSTDFCSTSPDQPLGFDFRLPCHRHDFGYRNYKAMNAFPANKSRLDDAFYNDLRTKCGTYNVFVRPACNSLAWTYYQAVRNFGSVSPDGAGFDRAEVLLTKGLAAQAATAR